jgi:hypothetical protein
MVTLVPIDRLTTGSPRASRRMLSVYWTHAEGVKFPATQPNSETESYFLLLNSMMQLLPRESNEVHAVKCELAAEVLGSYGTLRLQVTGWSMLPTIWPGDTLVVERVDPGSLTEGDIVLIGRGHRLFAHRLITKSVAKSGVLTRGDAMTAPDPRAKEKEVLGKVSFILRDGRCFEPRRTLKPSERAVAALVQRSEIAARLVVCVHDLRQSKAGQE